MIVMLRVFVAASVMLSLWFVVGLGDPRRSENPTMAWLWAALAGTSVVFDTLLLLALFAFQFPIWVWLVVLFAQDVVFAWRLVLLRRSRSSDEQEQVGGPT